YLYVAAWGTGELRQYDVTDPFAPRHTGTVELGGIAHRADHPSGRPWVGGPQMIEVSRDGARLYVTNSLYSTWDPPFYPEGVPGAMAKIDADPAGGISLDADFLVELDGHRAHRVHLEGGDSSTDSSCFSRQRGRKRPARLLARHLPDGCPCPANPTTLVNITKRPRGG
ncbi:MAG: selenium-binding protein SBP56-related protein, partial [Acidimicrobiales bacterium]